MTPFELGRQAGAAGGRVQMLPMGVRPLPNGLNASMSTLRMLIVSAYQIRDYQLVGGPSWLDRQRRAADRELISAVIDDSRAAYVVSKQPSNA